MTDAKTDVVPVEKVEAEDPQRRNLALALLGALGGVALLDGCADAGSNSTEPELLGTIRQRLSGADIKWVDTVLGTWTSTTRAGTLAENTSTNLSATLVIAEGCVTAGDGGGGIFMWRSSGTDDGGTFIVPNSAGTGHTGVSGAGWNRIFSGPLNVKWFGAVGNGSANDTAAITSAISAAKASGTSRTIYFPSGTYLTDPIALDATCSGLGFTGESSNPLVGSQGVGTSSIKLRAASTKLLQLLGCTWAHFSDLVFDGGTFADSVIYFPGTGATSGITFDRCSIVGATTNTGYLVNFDGTLEVDLTSFNYCSIRQNPTDTMKKAAVAIRNYNTNAFDINFNNCFISDATYLARFSAGSCNFYGQCQFIRWVNSGIRIESVCQPFVLESYTEGTDGIFFEQILNAGVTSARFIEFRDVQINSLADIKLVMTQAVIMGNVVTGGNINIAPDGTYGPHYVTCGRVSFVTAAKGFTGSGAKTRRVSLTHVENNIPQASLIPQLADVYNDTGATGGSGWDADQTIALSDGDAFYIGSLTTNRNITVSSTSFGRGGKMTISREGVGDTKVATIIVAGVTIAQIANDGLHPKWVELRSNGSTIFAFRKGPIT